MFNQLKRANKNDQLQEQQRRYDDLVDRVILLSDRYFHEHGRKPTDVYLRLDDLKFVRNFHEIRRVIHGLSSSQLNKLAGLELNVGEQMVVESKETNKYNWRIFMRRSSF